MKKVIKKKGYVVEAYQLGTNHPKLLQLIAERKIKRCSNGSYEVFSREAVNGKGETAQKGDYIKLDSKGFPYPNDKKFFEENHRKIGEDIYEQVPKPLDAWMIQEPICEEINYLMEEKGLLLDEVASNRYFNAPLWGSMLSAAKDAVLIFYRIDRDEAGKIIDADFNFVERKEFEKMYEFI